MAVRSGCLTILSLLVAPQAFAQEFFPNGSRVPRQLSPSESGPGRVVVPGQVLRGTVIGPVSDEISLGTTSASVQVNDSLKPRFDDSQEAIEASATPRSPRGDTWVETPPELKQLLTEGGVPDSLDVLRLLQRQQQLVASRAAKCTVSVQIGPAQGCGVIITDTGYVLTAAHVAMRPRKAAVLTLADGRTVTATTRGMNRNVDAGLMKIDEGQNSGRPWPHATLGKSEDLQVGMWCIATGHPGGYDRDRGMVTRVGRILDVQEKSLVTDCALIGGDSGGPLFDLSGRLIGVHSRIGNDVADNLHVPIDHYAEKWREMDQSQSWGYLEGFKPALGVRGDGSDPIANVKDVNSGSPAQAAGIEKGDVVERFGDVQITSFESLKAAVADTMPGERVKVWVRREGTLVPLVVEIGRANE